MSHFRDDLAFSERSSDDPFWRELLSVGLPGFVDMIRNPKDNAAQRLGIDRMVMLSSGAPLKVDLKARRTFYSDIALEVNHEPTRPGGYSAPGWMEQDKQIDVLAYAWIDARRGYLFPWPQLRRAWQINSPLWKEAMRESYRSRKGKDRGPEIGGIRYVGSCKNNGYRTNNCVIKTEMLVDAVTGAMLVSLDEEEPLDHSRQTAARSRLVASIRANQAQMKLPLGANP